MDILGINIIWILIPIIALIVFAILASLYRIVPADKADIVIQQGKRRVFSSDPEYSDQKKAAYYKIPSWVPGIGMKVHRMPLKILSINIPDFLAFDKDRARFLCDIVAYAVIKDPVVSAMRFPDSLEELGKQISKVVQATTRDSTTKKPIREIINDRQGIIEVIQEPLKIALANWGLELRDIELVEFKDPTEKEYGEEKPPRVIKNISSIIEVQVESEARQKNAEQLKIARLKEAEAEEIAKRREIEKEEKISMRDKIREQEIAKEAKKAMEETLEVRKVQQVKTQTIEKERSIVEANQRKEIEEINKEQKSLQGQGDRLLNEEKAKGEAAYIREKGYADADAKMKLQDALNKFGDEAIRALIAEKLVEMQKDISIATAKALEQADIRVFSGGGDAKQGFVLGEMLEGMSSASTGASTAVINRLARPNDLGFRDFGALLSAFEEWKKDEDQEKEQKRDEGRSETKSRTVHSKKDHRYYADKDMD